MAITTLAGLRAAMIHRVRFQIANPTGGNSGQQVVFREANQSPDMTTTGPTLAVLDGMVPVSGSPGYLNMPALGAGNKCYLAAVDHNPNLPQQARFEIFDALFVSGEHSTNGTVDRIYTTPPTSWQSRVTSYHDLEIWVEVNIATNGVGGPDLVGSTAIIVDYLDAGGVARSTPSFLIPQLDAGMAHQLPLQAGTKGVSGLTGIHISGGTSATATLNVRLLHPLCGAQMRVVDVGNGVGFNNFLQTGLPELDANTALYMHVSGSTTARGFETVLHIAEG